MVVTWPLKDDTENARAIECSFAIKKSADELSGGYLRRFGAAPKFRIGLHRRAVVISQIGDQTRVVLIRRHSEHRSAYGTAMQDVEQLDVDLR